MQNWEIISIILSIITLFLSIITIFLAYYSSKSSIIKSIWNKIRIKYNKICKLYADFCCIEKNDQYKTVHEKLISQGVVSLVFNINYFDFYNDISKYSLNEIENLWFRYSILKNFILYKNVSKVYNKLNKITNYLNEYNIIIWTKEEDNTSYNYSYNISKSHISLSIRMDKCKIWGRFISSYSPTESNFKNKEIMKLNKKKNRKNRKELFSDKFAYCLDFSDNLKIEIHFKKNIPTRVILPIKDTHCFFYDKKNIEEKYISNIYLTIMKVKQIFRIVNIYNLIDWDSCDYDIANILKEKLNKSEDGKLFYNDCEK